MPLPTEGARGVGSVLRRDRDDVEDCLVAHTAHRDGGQSIFLQGLELRMQLFAPGVVEQAQGEHGRFQDFRIGERRLADGLVVGVDTGGAVTKRHVPRAVEDHLVKDLVNLTFEHDVGLGLGDRAGGVPLDKGLDQIPCLRFIRRLLLAQKRTDDGAEIVVLHDVGEELLRTRTVGPVLQRNGRGPGSGFCGLRHLGQCHDNLQKGQLIPYLCAHTYG